MISKNMFITQSLELHLFFLRIMKEHSFFLETGFTPHDERYIKEADYYRNTFDGLLREVVALSNGVVSPEVLGSGEVYTQYTLSAESQSSKLTGIKIPSDITQSEINLIGGYPKQELSQELEQSVFRLNQKILKEVEGLVSFKSLILENLVTCKLFAANYPLLVEHIMREAKLYFNLIQRLQTRDMADLQSEILEQEIFWNQIMAEHSKFIRGLLDPSEDNLINIANDFGNGFDKLTLEAVSALDKTMPLHKVTDDSLEETIKIRDFKAQAAQGLTQCKIKSIALPLLADHVLREANHYLRLLEKYKQAL